jgi:flagellar assembly factor FliW
MITKATLSGSMLTTPANKFGVLNILKIEITFKKNLNNFQAPICMSLQTETK